MEAVLGQVSIEDFETFAEVFGATGAALRKKHGCNGARLFADTEDPSLAFVLLDWDREGILAYQRDPETAAMMREATAIAPPAYTYLEQEAEFPA